MSGFEAPVWLPGGHAQTIYPALGPRPVVRFERERWDTPDGDFIDLDWAGPDNARQTLVLFHGLEGSSRSHYACNIVAQGVANAWRCVIPHFRGCSGEINRLARAYHSGDSAEIDWILRRVHALQPDRPLSVAGISLGGNALLKWLGEQGAEATRLVSRAAAVSAPLDLAAAGNALGHGFNLVYTRMFLRTLKRKAAAKIARLPGIFDARAMHASRTLYEFDNVVTAPLHGFRDTDDYWSRSSSLPLLPEIRVPTLVLNARNDPFLPASALPGVHAASGDVKLEFPAAGGHVGFVSAKITGPHGWLAARLFEFFSDR